MSFPRYPNYKDSGVKWVGDVPANWEMISIRRLIAAPLWNGIFKKKEEFGAGVLLINVFDIYRSDFKIDFDSLDRVKCNQSEASNYDVLPGDLLFVRSSLKQEGIAVVAMAGSCPEPVVYECHLIRARLNGQVLKPRFGSYVMNSAVYRSTMVAKAKITTMTTIDQEAILSTQLPIPSILEQSLIAAFLDREAAKIDGLVAEQRRLMELLKEKRQVVISHAVTKGLNPHAPMKPSGIEWLGEVPEHWTVIPIRLVAKLESGHTPSRSHPEYWEDCTVPWFTLADVWQIREAKAEYIYETKEKVSEVGLANSSARLLPRDTVILSRTASVGFSAIMGVAMATTQDFANWICGPRLQPEFLLYALKSMQGEFRRLMMGSTHNTIYMPDIQSLRFVLPPRNEQAAIVKYVRIKTKEFDTLTAEAQRAIDLLKERRTALISAAVTGQIDVRGLVESEAA